MNSIEIKTFSWYKSIWSSSFFFPLSRMLSFSAFMKICRSFLCYQRKDEKTYREKWRLVWGFQGKATEWREWHTLLLNAHAFAGLTVVFVRGLFFCLFFRVVFFSFFCWALQRKDVFFFGNYNSTCEAKRRKKSIFFLKISLFFQYDFHYLLFVFYHFFRVSIFLFAIITVFFQFYLNV